jgi:hypothetical protein
MAVLFASASSQRWLRSSGATIDYNSAYTWMAWIYLTTLPSGSDPSILKTDNTGSYSSEMLRINDSNDSLRMDVENAGGSSNVVGSALSASTWYHVAIVRTSSSNLYVYLNGVLDITNTRSVASRGASSRMWVGSRDAGADFFNGRIHAMKLWQAALSAAEVQAEMHLVTPSRWSNLWEWYPIMPGATERVTGYANAYNFTEYNSPTDAASDNGIAWGGAQYILSHVAAGGPTYSISLSGGITPAGALVKRAGKLLSGDLMPAGALVKRPGKIFTGDLTPTGALGKRVGKVLSGGITPAGDLTKRPGKLFTGEITPAGALVKRAGKLFSGAIEPTGTLTALRALLQSLSGAITPTGSLTKRPGKLLTGDLSPSGGFSKRVNKVLGGGISLAGGFSKRVNKVLVGGITPTGTLAALRALLQSLSGAITPTGTLTKRASKLLTGDLAPAGITRRQVGKVLAGTLSLSGEASVTRGLQLALTGTLAPAGAVTKTLARSLAGTLIMAGVLVKAPRKWLNGFLTLAGEVTSPSFAPVVAVIWPRIYLRVNARPIRLEVKPPGIQVTFGARRFKIGRES